jgi:hypothetical protein
LERIVEERVGQTFVGTVSVAVERLAEEFAREAMADETFRRSIREIVRTRSEALFARLTSPRRPRRRTVRRAKP